MAAIVAQQTQRHPVLLPDRASSMAKAEVRKTDQEPRELVGKALTRTRLIVGWSLKECGAAFDRDESLVRGWESGEKRPPFDELLFHEVYGPVLVIELARMLAVCDVKTTIEIRRRA